jgi:hypothetical protein
MRRENLEKVMDICLLMMGLGRPEFETILRIAERASTSELKPAVAKKLIESHAVEIESWSTYLQETEASVEIQRALSGDKTAGADLHYLL